MRWIIKIDPADANCIKSTWIKKLSKTSVNHGIFHLARERNVEIFNPKKYVPTCTLNVGRGVKRAL